MSDLARRARSLGLSQVQTYRATGNLLFRVEGSTRLRLERSLQEAFSELFGAPVEVFLRSRRELMELLLASPFDAPPRVPGTPYVTFLRSDYRGEVSFRRLPSTEAVEIVGRRPTEILSWGHRVGGKPGFPNPYIERMLRAKATTRNWSTVSSVMDRWSR